MEKFNDKIQHDTCPFCESYNFFSEDFYRTENGGYNVLVCDNCNGTWIEYYKFTFGKVHDVPSVEEIAHAKEMEN